MLSKLVENVCESYDHEIDALNKDVRESRQLLQAAYAKILVLEQLVKDQAAVIEQARGVGESMLAAMDAELIVRDEQGRVSIQQGFVD